MAFIVLWLLFQITGILLYFFAYSRFKFVEDVVATTAVILWFSGPLLWLLLTVVFRLTIKRWIVLVQKFHVFIWIIGTITYVFGWLQTLGFYFYVTTFVYFMTGVVIPLLIRFIPSKTSHE